jgi:1-acyl-sn-glycerol-3-phosphate acyltransferase
MANDDSVFLIDIDKVLREKAPDKAKYIPGFVVSYLKRIVHQEELNEILTRLSDRQGTEFAKGALDELNDKIVVRGEENLPKDGKVYTFVSNHPLGGQDGLALGAVLGEHYQGKIKFLVNDLLMNLHGLAPFFIPINKTGKQAKDFPRLVEAGFASQENQLIIFPAGICSRKQNGVIKDLDWKKTFVTKCVQYQRDVVPIHFDGRNSDFFYNLANMCKWLGIKFNIAMLYLADEMFKNSNKTFTVTIGKPIPWQTFDHSKTPHEWAQYVKEIVYKLNIPSKPE